MEHVFEIFRLPATAWAFGTRGHRHWSRGLSPPRRDASRRDPLCAAARGWDPVLVHNLSGPASHATGSSGGGRVKGQDARRPIQIMLVEDNPGDVLLVREALAAGNVMNDLATFDDGASALERLNDLERALPDLILLDLNLPGSSGIDVLVRIREHDRTTHLPVIMLTTSDADADVRSAYSSHVSSYITKPVDFPAFVEAMKQLERFWLQIVELPVESDPLANRARCRRRSCAGKPGGEFARSCGARNAAQGAHGSGSRRRLPTAPHRTHSSAPSRMLSRCCCWKTTLEMPCSCVCISRRRPAGASRTRARHDARRCAGAAHGAPLRHRARGSVAAG